MQKSRSGKMIKFEVNEGSLLRLVSLHEKAPSSFPKFGILVLTYNHAKLIEKTLSRIDERLMPLIQEIFVFDDRSPDDTYTVASKLVTNPRWHDKLSVFKNSSNLGYGGNQKVGYQYGIEKDLDYVLMLHGDGQYAPEYIADLFLKAIETSSELVFASRMMDKNQAISGGMPVYKYIGNKILTSFENFMLRTNMSEFHSGYRMYATSFLKKVPFHENTDDFYFDTEIIIQARHLGSSVEEVPIQAFYGDEECNVNGFSYALDVCKAVVLYRLHQLHFIRKSNYIVNRSFVHKKKTSPFSSHQMILHSIPSGAGRVLYIGKNENLLSDELLQKGYEVDLILDKETELVSHEEGLRVQRQNFQNLSLDYQREFDYVILGDVLPQTVDPEELVAKAHRILKKDGVLICSVPNIAIWLYRLSLLMGRFNYAPAGTLDYRNLRFFTKFSLLRVFKRQGLVIDTIKYTSLPFEVFFESSGKSFFLSLIDRLYYLKVKLWPSLFCYQFVTSVKVKSLVDEAASSVEK